MYYNAFRGHYQVQKFSECSEYLQAMMNSQSMRQYAILLNHLCVGTCCTSNSHGDIFKMNYPLSWCMIFHSPTCVVDFNHLQMIYWSSCLKLAILCFMRGIWIYIFPCFCSLLSQPGRLKNVQAIGWYLEEANMAQVSLNLTDHEVTPIHTVYEEVCKDAQVQLRVNSHLQILLSSLLSSIFDWFYLGIEPGCGWIPDCGFSSLESHAAGCRLLHRQRKFLPTGGRPENSSGELYDIISISIWYNV